MATRERVSCKDASCNVAAAHLVDWLVLECRRKRSFDILASETFVGTLVSESVLRAAFWRSSNTLTSAVRSSEVSNCRPSLVDLSLDDGAPFLLAAVMVGVCSRSPWDLWVTVNSAVVRLNDRRAETSTRRLG